MAESSPPKLDIVDRHLKRAWAALTPPEGFQEQVRARLTGSTAATMGALGLSMASNARPPSAWASLQSSGKLGALVGAALVGVGVLAGYVIRDSQGEAAPAAAVVMHRSEERAPAAPPLPAARVEARSETTPGEVPAAPLAPPARPHPARPSAGRLVPGQTPPERTREPVLGTRAAEASDELALLRRADRAVRADNAALALALIAELEVRHPSSRLLEERRAIELLAHCGAGATDAAARARRFLREHPISVYAGRIRQACPAEPAENAPVEPRLP